MVENGDGEIVTEHRLRKALGKQLKDSLTHKSAHGLLTSVPKLPNINIRSWYFDVD